MVGRLTLDQEVGVRVPAPQPHEAAGNSGFLFTTVATGGGALELPREELPDRRAIVPIGLRRCPRRPGRDGASRDRYDERRTQRHASVSGSRTLLLDCGQSYAATAVPLASSTRRRTRAQAATDSGQRHVHAPRTTFRVPGSPSPTSRSMVGPITVKVPDVNPALTVAVPRASTCNGPTWTSPSSIVTRPGRSLGRITSVTPTSPSRPSSATTPNDSHRTRSVRGVRAIRLVAPRGSVQNPVLSTYALPPNVSIAEPGPQKRPASFPFQTARAPSEGEHATGGRPKVACSSKAVGGGGTGGTTFASSPPPRHADATESVTATRNMATTRAT
jgi:hypothetical protein